MAEYRFGNCSICGRSKPLKDGMCSGCNQKSKGMDMPDFFKGLFKGKNSKSNNDVEMPDEFKDIFNK